MELQTKRLLLRPITINDKASIAQKANDEEIARNTLTIPFPYTEDNAEEWINSMQEPSNNIVLGITINNQVIGVIGLHKIVENHKAEVGYWLGRSYWGQGYMTEAVNAIIKYGFDELQLVRLCANVFTHNIGSAKVLEKSGFVKEGILRKEAKKPDGTLLDEIRYALLKEDYRPQEKLII